MNWRNILRFIGQPVSITMSRRGYWRKDEVPNYPIISLGGVSLGQLIYHKARRHPSDPVWTVETIGL